MEQTIHAGYRGQVDDVRPQAVFMGGTLSLPAEITFAERLGAAMIAGSELAVVVSGYRGVPVGKVKEVSPAFGFCVASGAQHAAGDAADGRVFTQISPASGDSEQYFSIGRAVHQDGKSRQVQQLSVVLSAAVVCLAGGSSGTRTLYDYALGLDRPVLPLPFFGGAAKTIWRKHRQDICRGLGIEKAVASRWSQVVLDTLSDEETDHLVDEVAGVLIRAARKRCLVFMPFAAHFDWVFGALIAPAAAKATVDLVRIDMQDYVGDIVGMFEKELALADLTIAVVTGDSPNVFYEIGYTHAVGKPVLILCQQGGSTMTNPDTPFYIRNHKTVWYPSRFDEEGLRRSIDELALALRRLAPVRSL